MKRPAPRVPSSSTERTRPRALTAVLALLLATLVSACGISEKSEPSPGEASVERGAPAITPPPDARWQYQLEASPDRADDATGRIDVDICERPANGGRCVTPEVIDFDLYVDRRGSDRDDRPNTAAVDALHERGGYAVCYVDAGSAELFRPDFRRFRAWHLDNNRSLLGKPFSKRFPDERWINIGGERQRRFVLGIMAERTAKCAQAGFDGIEYDVVEAWSAGKRTTGWSISRRDQLVYNRSLAEIAHSEGLAVGLKNDLGQARQLEPDFDFAISEECLNYRECGPLKAFTNAGKPVFHVEYELAPKRFCGDARRLGFNSIKKARDFSLRPQPYVPCE